LVTRTGFAALAAVIALPSPAGAVGAEEGMISLEGAYARDVRLGSGAALGLAGSLGLDDAWAVGLTVRGAGHQGPQGTLALLGGVTYALDMLRLVPFVDLGLGVAAGTGRAGGGYHVGLGAEYLMTRRWAIGLAGRWHHYPLRFAGADAMSLATVGLRLGWILE